MRNPLAAHPPARQILIVSVALPVAITLAVLAFTWPVARAHPRSVPVGVVGSTPTVQQVVSHLEHDQPGAFDFRFFPSAGSAANAIRKREVYGAFVVAGGQLEVLEASAAGRAVAQVLTDAGQKIPPAADAGAHPLRLSTVDVVPLSSKDPNGLVLSSALLPLTICSLIVASVIGVVVRFRPAWRQLVAVTTVSAVAGAGAYLVGQTWLGAFPAHGAADWGSLALTIAAMASATAGLIALIGVAGLGAAAALFVFVGNPFAGGSTAPDLLPAVASHLGQWLPPGAGLNLLRSTAYFNGHGSGSHVAILVTWTVVGFLAIVAGHHGPVRFAASLPESGMTR
jgi:hypothetical protein